MVSAWASRQSQAWINLSSRKSPAPAGALDSAQKTFDLSIECRRLFQINGVAGIGTNPKARIGEGGFEHQVCLKAADILVTHGEQYRNRHVRQLISQIMQ